MPELALVGAGFTRAMMNSQPIYPYLYITRTGKNPENAGLQPIISYWWCDASGSLLLHYCCSDNLSPYRTKTVSNVLGFDPDEGRMPVLDVFWKFLVIHHSLSAWSHSPKDPTERR
jgi:hypothetical protein